MANPTVSLKKKLKTERGKKGKKKTEEKEEEKKTRMSRHRSEFNVQKTAAVYYRTIVRIHNLVDMTSV